jgi:NAD(P)-dependent dehydrogenase (short-subunit alcohol dehydrogenase family)
MNDKDNGKGDAVALSKNDNDEDAGSVLATDAAAAAAAAAACSPPGPVLQAINRILHRRPVATIVHGLYWTVVLSVAVPVSLWVLVLRTVFLLVMRRPRYVAALEEQAPGEEVPSEYAVVITGCDSGFGHELAVRAAAAATSGLAKGRRRFVVFAGCYSKENVGPESRLFRGIDNVHPLLMDVTQDDQVESAVEHVRAWLQSTTTMMKTTTMPGGDGSTSSSTATDKTERRRFLHAVVNNAGVGYGGDTDWLSLEQIQHTMDGACVRACVHARVQNQRTADGCAVRIISSVNGSPLSSRHPCCFVRASQLYGNGSGMQGIFATAQAAGLPNQVQARPHPQRHVHGGLGVAAPVLGSVRGLQARGAVLVGVAPSRAGAVDHSGGNDQPDLSQDPHGIWPRTQASAAVELAFQRNEARVRTRLLEGVSVPCREDHDAVLLEHGRCD